MQIVVLILAAILVLHTVQAFFLAPLMLALPLSPIAIAGGFAALKVALAAMLFSFFGNHITGRYSAGVRAGSGIRDLLHQTELASSGFTNSPLVGGTQDLLGPATAWTTTEDPQVTVKIPVAALEQIMKADAPKRKRATNSDLDGFFSFLHDVNDDGCVSRLICENTADSKRFGKLGAAMLRFFAKRAGSDKSTPASEFVAAGDIGRRKGVPGCAATYSNCTVDIPHVVTLAGLM